MFISTLKDLLGSVCHLEPRQMERLHEHYKLLVRWNRRLSLTSIRGEADIIERHYCESLFLGAHLPNGDLSIADIGSGAGFPGLPVAILRTECSITLIESNQRKAVFLRESCRDLANVRVVSARAEDVTLHFDWVISRAVAAPEVRLAARVALLAGESPPVGAVEWQPRIQLPWGKRRYLWLGAVPRETRST